MLKILNTVELHLKLHEPKEFRGFKFWGLRVLGFAVGFRVLGGVKASGFRA